MFTKLAERWRDNFNATVPSQPLGMNEWGAVIAFSWWLNKNAAEQSVHPTGATSLKTIFHSNKFTVLRSRPCG